MANPYKYLHCELNFSICSWSNLLRANLSSRFVILLLIHSIRQRTLAFGYAVAPDVAGRHIGEACLRSPQKSEIFGGPEILPPHSRAVPKPFGRSKWFQMVPRAQKAGIICVYRKKTVILQAEGHFALKWEYDDRWIDIRMYCILSQLMSQ